MGYTAATDGWKISQVVSLLDMPQRDITRSCYADRKRGGAGILQPTDGSWGRRSYSVEDIAWLYLVKLQHDQGISLPEIALRMDTSAGTDALCGHLAAVAARAQEAMDDLQATLERAQALQCALDPESSHAKGAQAALEQHLRDKLGDERFEALLRVIANNGTAATADAHDRALAREALELPGMDLAVELLAGPGASELSDDL